MTNPKKGDRLERPLSPNLSVEAPNRLWRTSLGALLGAPGRTRGTFRADRRLLGQEGLLRQSPEWGVTTTREQALAALRNGPRRHGGGCSGGESGHATPREDRRPVVPRALHLDPTESVFPSGRPPAIRLVRAPQVSGDGTRPQSPAEQSGLSPMLGRAACDRVAHRTGEASKTRNLGCAQTVRRPPSRTPRGRP